LVSHEVSKNIELMIEKEKDIIAGCVKGEKAAWDAFVRQYSNLIYHTIKKTFSLHHAEPRQDVVDDLFQEIFLSLVKDDFAQLRRFRGDKGCTLASWLRMIAARRTIDQLRKSKPQTQKMTDACADSGADLSDVISDNQLSESLNRALETLRSREKILIDLLFRQNLSAQDAASILRISVGAVYTQKNRVLAKLRETLEKITSA
jgi:RNA polymerase sigma-70 factor, ECF subfamily